MVDAAMSLVLGVIQGRVELSKEALGMTDKEFLPEVKKWLSKSRLLGIDYDLLSDYDFIIRLSDESFLSFGKSERMKYIYYICDDTEVIVPKFSNNIRIYAESKTLSIDLQKYAHGRFRKSRLITINTDRYATLDIKIKCKYSVNMVIEQCYKANIELEGVRGALNTIAIGTIDVNDVAVNRAENVICYGTGEDESCFKLSKEQSREFIALCRQQGQSINAGGSDIENIAVEGYDDDTNTCCIRYSKRDKVELLADAKVADFIYSLQRV